MSIRADSTYSYVLYIDEAGDDGLTKVKPLDSNGATEWLCISGLLVRAENEHLIVDWVRSIRKDINAVQGPALHFRNLSPTKKKRACSLLAKHPVRSFCVLSNKKNMRGWDNERAAKRGGKQWFYNFCVRLLMERVTDFCHRDSMKNFGEVKPIKVVFSERGGHSYGQTMAYWELLKTQASGESTYLRKREIRLSTLRFNLVHYAPHWQVAGLQLADIVASAFYSAADPSLKNWNLQPAKALRPTIPKENGSTKDYGVVLQPTPPHRANLTNDQKMIFQSYGYYFQD